MAKQPSREELAQRHGWIVGGQGDEETRAEAYREQHAMRPLNLPINQGEPVMPKEKKPAGDVGERQVAEAMEEVNDQGFVGEKVDPTPNSAYTFGGVTQQQPTPETDAAAARAAEAEAGLGVEARVDTEAEPPK